MTPTRTNRHRAGNALTYVLLLGAILIWAFPVLWVVLTSIKPRTDIFTNTPTLAFLPTLDHYEAALNTRGIVDSIRNSLVITIASTVFAIVVAVPAAYAFARLRFRFKTSLSFYTLFMQMAPPIGLLIPYFFALNRLRLLDTYVGLIVIYLSFTLPFSIWIMITYFLDVPKELEEAAAVDGASRFAAFLRIVVPQVRGGIAVTAIFAFINAWNEFLYAVVLTGPDTQTVTVAIFGFLGASESRWGPFTATGTMIMAPVVVVALIAQKQIVRGLGLGSVKG
ncbi:MAG: carbohydrate ABC transporter permease [Chloroflexota bacterium]|nr:carbohydrate ABC transporter permease [Chloroflexota bacterium]